MANIVILGSGLGGLPAAYELRHLLPKEHRVIVITDQSHFTFLPSLVRVAFGLQQLAAVQLELAKILASKGIELIQAAVVDIDPDQKTVATLQETLNYDYLVIATGASLAFDCVSGLGPHHGYTQSVCTPDHALQAKEKWQEFLDNPGDLIVGAMPDAGCFGPAYEFILMADDVLRKKGLRDRYTLTYVTPEPYVGHFGIEGVANSQKLTEKLFSEREIRAIANSEIIAVTPDQIHLADGQSLPFQYAMILPSFRGAKFLQGLAIADAQGFIPVTATYHHPEYPQIYAAGIAVALKNPIQTSIPMSVPKSGAMTEAMATAIAHNIAVDLGVLNRPKQVPTLESVCLAEFGDTGIAYVAIPVFVDPNSDQPRRAYALQGAWVNWGKAALERYFMLKMKWGLGVPWFERLGLQLLFQVRITKEVPPQFVKLFSSM